MLGDSDFDIDDLADRGAAAGLTSYPRDPRLDLVTVLPCSWWLGGWEYVEGSGAAPCRDNAGHAIRGEDWLKRPRTCVRCGYVMDPTPPPAADGPLDPPALEYGYGDDAGESVTWPTWAKAVFLTALLLTGALLLAIAGALFDQGTSLRR